MPKFKYLLYKWNLFFILMDFSLSIIRKITVLRYTE